MEAAVKLVEKLGATVAQISFLVELPPLRGREKLKGYDVYALMGFDVE
jgi:adenine phosphoribosyltransferase